jgi:hypothetical protein
MYKIEKFLIDNGMKLKKSYPVGTLVYQDYCSDPEDEGFYGVDEIILFPNHKTDGNPTPTWEISTSYPYMLIIPGYKELDPEFIERCKENLEEHLKATIEFNKRLLEIENPWEEVEQKA